MKIRGMYINNRKYTKKWVYIMFVLFLGGIILGTCYSIGLRDDGDSSVVNYLNSYFHDLNSGTNNFNVLKNSLASYFKLFIVISASAFFRAGLLFISSSVILRGFILGFTTASFMKYYGIRGLLVASASVPSTVVFVPCLIIFSSVAMVFCINRHNRESKDIKNFILLSICYLTIFCAVSILDAFITTTFMKLFSSIIAVN